jgi:hypothetical protein
MTSLLGYKADIWRNIMSPSSGLSKLRKKPAETGGKLVSLLSLLFETEDGGDIFLRIVELCPNYTVLQPRINYSLKE